MTSSTAMRRCWGVADSPAILSRAVCKESSVETQKHSQTTPSGRNHGRQRRDGAADPDREQAPGCVHAARGHHAARPAADRGRRRSECGQEFRPWEFCRQVSMTYKGGDSLPSSFFQQKFRQLISVTLNDFLLNICIDMCLLSFFYCIQFNDIYCFRENLRFQIEANFCCFTKMTLILKFLNFCTNFYFLFYLFTFKKKNYFLLNNLFVKYFFCSW